MQPLMYCTVSETPSSPSPPIGPDPNSAQPKEEGASSTGEEPPSVYWTALELCVFVFVWVGGVWVWVWVDVWVWVGLCVDVCVGLYINMVFHTTSRSTVREELNVSSYVCSGHHTCSLSVLFVS